MTRPPLVLLIAMLTACGSSNENGDDTQRPGPDASMPDARAPDAAIPDAAAPEFVVIGGGNAVPAWSFGDTPVGNHGNVTLTVTNTSGVATQALAVAVTASGNAPGADQFAIDPSSTCAGKALAAGATCQVVVAFNPAGDAGARTAILQITGAATPFLFALTGTAAPPVSGLSADVSSIDFGLIELAHPTVQHVTLTNGSTTTLTLGTPSTTSIFANAGTGTCSTSLAPSASCTIDVQFTPGQLGTSTGMLTVPSSANTVTVALTGTGARRLSVTVVGSGRVSSTPTDINCASGTCSALFAGDAVFTATPDTDHAFSGWTPICGMATTCTVPQASNTALTATFAATTGTHKLHITFTGTGLGQVVFNQQEDVLDPCNTDCTLDVTAGNHVILQYRTPSTFGGWLGDCVLSSDNCVLDMTSDKTVTVAFDHDDREIATFLPAHNITALAFAGNGDLLIGDSTGIRQMTLAGAPVWSFAITGGVDGIVTDSAGRIYGSGGKAGSRVMFALTADGNKRWITSVVLAIPTQDTQALVSPVQVSPDGSVVAGRSASGISVFDNAGASRYSVAASAVDGLAVDANGIVAFGTRNSIEGDDIHRYDTTGSELPAWTATIPRVDASLAFDAGNNLAACSSGHSRTDATLISAAGTQLWDASVRTDAADHSAGMALDSDGNPVVALELNETFLGLGVRQFRASDGTILWSLDKKAAGAVITAPLPSAIAADHAKHVAVAGTFDAGPWIAIYLMP